MKWNRQDVVGLAEDGCTTCFGNGTRNLTRNSRNLQHGTTPPCNCVYRAIFRDCYARFKYCVQNTRHISAARLERIPGAVNGPRAYGRKNEEFTADFCNVSRRVLDDPLEYRLFRYHFLLGADWKACCRRLNMDRGAFFHSVYRIQQKLGRAYRELRPYSLYPLNEYFGGSVSTHRVKACIVPRTGPRHFVPRCFRLRTKPSASCSR